jgi:hypothetical protein
MVLFNLPANLVLHVVLQGFSLHSGRGALFSPNGRRVKSVKTPGGLYTVGRLALTLTLSQGERGWRFAVERGWAGG